MKSVRKTIMLDGDLDKKIRLIQAMQIRELNASVSFSQVFNDALRAGLKNKF